MSDAKIPDKLFATIVIAGFVASTVAGYFAIGYFLRFVRTRPLRAFAFYLFAFCGVSAVVLAIRG